jgi:uncharacterized protein (TIGR03067 family)
MRLLVPLLLVALPLWAAPAPFLPKKPLTDQAELNALQGKWEIMRVGVGNRMRGVGAPVPPDEFLGYQFRTNWLPGVKSWWVHIDPRKTPKELDLINSVGGVLPCIYRLEGDTFTLCWDHGEGTRPTDFTPRVDGYVLLYKRKKP